MKCSTVYLGGVAVLVLAGCSNTWPISTASAKAVQSAKNTADLNRPSEFIAADEFMITHSPQYLERHMASERSRTM